MSEDIKTLVGVSPRMPGEQPKKTPEMPLAEQETVRELIRQARASGATLTDTGGLGKAGGQDGRRATPSEQRNE